MTGSTALTVIAVSVAVMAVLELAAVLVLWQVANRLASTAHQLQERAETLQRLATDTVGRVGATVDQVGRTAQRIGQVAGAVGGVVQSAGAGAWVLRRLAGRGATAAANGARTAALKTGIQLAGALIRVLAKRREAPAGQAAAGNGVAAGTRAQLPPGRATAEGEVAASRDKRG